MVGITAVVVFILAVSVPCIQGEVTNKSGVSKPEKRIIGGEFAIPHEFPHHVLVYKKLSEEKGELCGGSLLTPEWVLTAAHCVHEPVLGVDSFVILAGQHSGPSIIIDPGVRVSKAQKVFAHPCYNGVKEMNGHASNIINDIGLIKLSSPFTLNENISTIEIDETDRAKPGAQVTAVGWGRKTPNHQSSDPFPAQLKKVTLKLPNTEIDCHETIGPLLDAASQICANDMAGYVCSGDSGGPLLCKDGGVNYVCGISSFVHNLSCSDGPSAFVRVFHYRNWINQVMATDSTSSIGCVIPKSTLPPRTTENVVNIRLLNQIDMSPSNQIHKSTSVYGFCIGVTLISLMFTFTY